MAAIPADRLTDGCDLIIVAQLHGLDHTSAAAMTHTDLRNPERGIPLELAKARAGAVSGLRYNLRLHLSEDRETPVSGAIRIDFELPGNKIWPPLDFAPHADDERAKVCIHSLTANGRNAAFRLCNGHIVINGPPAPEGMQSVEIEFEAGTGGLRRRSELIYSLYVPALAHTVFPCFDQPDLRAPLTLELRIPAEWDALANAPELSRVTSADRLTITYAGTEPLPTYLYAFAAGRLVRCSGSAGSRTCAVLCAPAAATQLEQNLDEILHLHDTAIEHCEDYTGIDYPFAQLGFVLIPDFDFGGMEHPGAIFYRQDLLLLPPTANDAQLQRRAGLIAHETAHMWFGNLVTMRWFGEVWLKEVFANFMADRVLAALFPETDHELAFMLRHYPPVSAIDRTEGTHPIRQPLANLAEAGELYDALIYHKAPIAMTALEQAIGEPAMHTGLRTWLDRHRFANSDWSDLLSVLQQQTQFDLTEFSTRWLDTPGRHALASPFNPVQPLPYAAQLDDEQQREQALYTLTQTNEIAQRARHWLVLYEDMLNGGIEPERLLTAALEILAREDNSLLLDRLLTDTREIYWRFIEPGRRAIAAGPVERTIRLRLKSSDRPGFWLSLLARFALTEESLAELEVIWRANDSAATDLSERKMTQLALTVAVHRSAVADEILDEQIRRIHDPARRQRLEFLRPAVAADAAVRDDLFSRLLTGTEPGRWQVAALELLNHPLRAAERRHLLAPGIVHACEIRRRGEIFMPRQWLTALFSGHSGPEAAHAIRKFMESETLPERLRQLILQTADPVFRSERLACR